MSSIPKKVKHHIDGIILLNKPKDISSNKALQIVKHLIGAKKAGHTGALDPLATGLLPLCFGQATKLADYLLGDNKVYIVTAKLGERTTTSDADGELIQTKPVPQLDKNSLQTYINQFIGDIEQTPSMYSALKYQGKPYYYYARNNINIPRVTRTITIFNIDILSCDQETISLRVHCSKGTYIRTLIDDLGELIGCGAHVTVLHRESIDNIKAPMVELDELKQLATTFEEQQNPYPILLQHKIMLPISDIVSFDQINLSEQQLDLFKKGTLKEITHLSNSPFLCLNNIDGHLYGLAKLVATNTYHITHRFIFGFGNYQ